MRLSEAIRFLFQRKESVRRRSWDEGRRLESEPIQGLMYDQTGNTRKIFIPELDDYLAQDWVSCSGEELAESEEKDTIEKSICWMLLTHGFVRRRAWHPQAYVHLPEGGRLPRLHSLTAGMEMDTLLIPSREDCLAEDWGYCDFKIRRKHGKDDIDLHCGRAARAGEGNAGSSEG